jgi:ubiquinone/menaquinone biosynthesis C-methylase UbiE
MNKGTPLPPLKLSARIGGSEEQYDQIGSHHAAFLRSMLPEDLSWDQQKVLDFGCGTGRTLVHFLTEARTGEFWGCDIDVASIEWAQANLSPPFHFVANGERPPLDLRSGTFDVVYGISVFTHLVQTWADWLLEMHRLLKVGGYAVFTFLGEGMIRELTGREWDENRVGMIGLDVGRPWDLGGPNVLHSEWWLRAHWGRLFEIVSVRPSSDLTNKWGHGWIALRKDERSPPSRQELERPEPDEPRELASLQFNIELLQERVADIWSTPKPAPQRVAAEVVERAWYRIPRRLRRRVRALRERPRDPWPSVGGTTWFDDHFDAAADDVIAFLAGDGLSLEGLEVADVGAGDGIIDLGLALKTKPARLVGYDINPTDTAKLLEQARKHRVASELPSNLEFIQSEPTKIPAADDSFDVVVTWSTFEHVADPPALLHEIKRILRPQGLLFLQLWPFYHSEHGGHLWEWFPGEAFVALRYSRDEIAATMRTNPQGEADWVERRLEDFETLNRINLNDLQQAITEAGFHIGKVEVLTNVVHLPRGLDRKFPLTDLMTAGVKLLAAPR